MQKYSQLLNNWVAIVVRDITGLTGLAIIESIWQGETDAATLATLRNSNCRKTESEIAKALQSKKTRLSFCIGTGTTSLQKIPAAVYSP
jgi:transposase